MYQEVISELEKLKDPQKANILSKFFKSGKGEYGEGDVFLGIKVPQTRIVAKKYFSKIDLEDAKQLLLSKIHEHRLIALLMLVEKYQKSDDSGKEKIYDFYMTHSQLVNNWDLVDSSADKIIGAHLMDKDKGKLYEYAKSENLWQRRISIISTFYFIKKGKFSDTLKIAEILLSDKHDLIHKAVGWMLREMGKRGGEKELLEFLEMNSKKMPRTMLRYAIERLNLEQKAYYMAKK